MTENPILDGPVCVPEEKHEYTLTESITAIVCIVLGYFYLRCVAVNGGHGIGGGIFFTLFSLTGFFALKKSGRKFSRFGIFLFVMSLVFAAELFITANEYARFASGFSSLVSSALFFYCTSFGIEKVGHLFGADLTGAAVKRPFEKYFSVFPASVSAVKGKNSEKRTKSIGYIITGLIFAIPAFLVILFLLMSADERMEKTMDSIFSSLIVPDEFISRLITFGFSLFIACGLFSMIFSAIICNKTADEHELEKQASADAYAKIHGLILYTAVVPICLIYIIFFALQADYFMNAFIGYLPDGISYSEYARRGFFELCMTAVINAGIIIIINGLCLKTEDGKKPKALRFFTVFLSVSTVLLVATALSKMVLYISKFGWTQKRIYASILMIALALVFIGVIIKQFMPDFDLSLTAFVITAVMMSVFSFANVDSFIVRENYRLYNNGAITDFDRFDLNALSCDAVPALNRIYADDNNLEAGNAVFDILSSRNLYSLNDSLMTVIAENCAFPKD